MKKTITSRKSSVAWGGQKNISRIGRDKGIPPSIEKLMMRINNSLSGLPPFCYSDVGRVIFPPITKGLDQLPKGENQKVAVIGSGLSGMIAALELAKLGYSVSIYEAKDYVGGRFGSVPLESSPSGIWEHGLHHFFVHVYDFLMQKIEEIGAYTNLKPVDNVYIHFENYENETLTINPNVHILNLLGILYRSPNVNLLDSVKSMRGMLPALFYDHEKAIKKYDHLTMQEYTLKSGISKSFYDTFIKTVLTVSINRMTNISAAQVLQMMWVFFLCRTNAMLRMVPTDNHYSSIFQPFLNHLQDLGVKIYTEHEVQCLELEDGKVKGIKFLNGETIDCNHLIIATDVKGAQEILNQTKVDLQNQKMLPKLQNVINVIEKIKIAPPYVVARAYFLQKPNNPSLPDVIETPENQPVDLVFQPHKTEKKEALWVDAAQPGEERWVLELHAYDLGPSVASIFKMSADESKCLTDDKLWALIQKLSDEQLWDILKSNLLNIDGLENMASAPLYSEGGLQLRRYFNFSGFQPGQGNRPSTFFAERDVENMIFVGDWIAIQGKDGSGGNPGKVYPGGNLMGHAASVAGIAAGVIAAKNNVIGPYVTIV
jgi:uncharacterized protein with NAD-binding domain and iron-sulfur cluster